MPGVSWDKTDILNIFQQMPTKSLLEMREDAVYLPNETLRVPGRNLILADSASAINRITTVGKLSLLILSLHLPADLSALQIRAPEK